MSAATVLPELSTAEAFVAWMARQPVRHEMVEGRLVMMAGGSNAHVTIAGNLLVALRNRLRGGPCRPFGSDFMVELDPRNRFYPDVSVACGETRDWTDRPILVAEVLSPATRRFDLSVKLPRYLTCPGLRHVLYLEPDRPLARLWVPGEPPGDPAIVAGLDARLLLPGLGLELPMAELYEDVALG